MSSQNVHSHARVSSGRTLFYTVNVRTSNMIGDVKPDGTRKILDMVVTADPVVPPPTEQEDAELKEHAKRLFLLEGESSPLLWLPGKK